MGRPILKLQPQFPPFPTNFGLISIKSQPFRRHFCSFQPTFRSISPLIFQPMAVNQQKWTTCERLQSMATKSRLQPAINQPKWTFEARPMPTRHQSGDYQPLISLNQRLNIETERGKSSSQTTPNKKKNKTSSGSTSANDSITCS